MFYRHPVSNRLRREGIFSQKIRAMEAERSEPSGSIAYRNYRMARALPLQNPSRRSLTGLTGQSMQSSQPLPDNDQRDIHVDQNSRDIHDSCDKRIGHQRRV
jgi:hypothetical protein